MLINDCLKFQRSLKVRIYLAFQIFVKLGATIRHARANSILSQSNVYDMNWFLVLTFLKEHTNKLYEIVKFVKRGNYAIALTSYRSAVTLVFNLY